MGLSCDMFVIPIAVELLSKAGFNYRIVNVHFSTIFYLVHRDKS